MDTFKQNAIAYVKKNMECAGYRDYIVEHLESENLYDAIEDYKHEVTKTIEDDLIDEVEERTMMWCLDTLDKHIEKTKYLDKQEEQPLNIQAIIDDFDDINEYIWNLDVATDKENHEKFMKIMQFVRKKGDKWKLIRG